MKIKVYDESLELEGDIELTLDLIIKYYFYKKYHKDFEELNYYLEENAKKFVKDLEYKWSHNLLDEYSLINSIDLKRFILEKCYKDIHFEEQYSSLYDEITSEEYLQLVESFNRLYNIDIEKEDLN